MAATPVTLRAMKRQRTVRLARLLSRALYLRQRGRQKELYNLVCDEMVSMGGVYVKFLQGVLLNGKAMRHWTNPDRLKIFENLETEEIDIIHMLREELPAAVIGDIALINPKPFAAGSFGQVYLGKHRNGKHIIIKVLRPQIRELLRHDLRLLGIFTKRFTAGEHKNITMKIDQAIKEFREVTLRETDYISEAAFARELYEAYRDHPKLVIPETYMELCTQHIIVQDYIGGISAVDLLKIREKGDDPKHYVAQELGSDLDQQLITLGVESLRSIFNLPRVQGDPHPGNIRFLPDDKVGMIDFGISAEAPENKAAFFGILEQWSRLYQTSRDFGALFEQFMRYFVTDLYKALRKVSSYAGAPAMTDVTADGAKSGGEANFTKELGRMMQEMLNAGLGTTDIQTVLEDGRMLQIFNSMVNKGNRFGLVVRLNSSEILRASQTYMTMVDALGRRKQVLPQVFMQSVEIIQREHPDVRNDEEPGMSITQALETINSWLERVAARDPALFNKLLQRIKLKGTKPIATAETPETSHA